MVLLLPVELRLLLSVKQRLGIQPAVGVVHDMLPGDVMWGIEAGIDVCHQLLGQGTGIVEDATEQPQTGGVSPELQQVCHPLPCCCGVQSDVGVANMHVFPG